MMIVDTHIHIWRERNPSALHRQVASFWTGDLLALMDNAKVDAAVLIPPTFFPEGNILYREEAKAHPNRLAVWSAFPVEDPARCSELATWRASPSMLGARFIYLTSEGRRRWTDGSMDWVWPAAERAGMPLGLYAPGHLKLVATVAETHPRLRLMVEHMGLDVFARGPASWSELPELLGLARWPNVTVKLSGLPAQSAESWPFRDTHEPLRRVIDAFGPERCFWGSDLTRLPCSYQEAVTSFTEGLSWLDGDSLGEIMGRAFSRWSGWPPPAI